MNIWDIYQEVESRQELIELREKLFAPLLAGEEFTAESLWKATRCSLAVAALVEAERELPRELIERFQAAGVREAMWLVPRETVVPEEDEEGLSEAEALRQIEELLAEEKPSRSELSRLAEFAPGDHLEFWKLWSRESRPTHFGLVKRRAPSLSQEVATMLAESIEVALESGYSLRRLPTQLMQALGQQSVERLRGSISRHRQYCDGYSLIVLSRRTPGLEGEKQFWEALRERRISMPEFGQLQSEFEELSGGGPNSLFKEILLNYERFHQTDYYSLRGSTELLLSSEDRKKAVWKSFARMPDHNFKVFLSSAQLDDETAKVALTRIESIVREEAQLGAQLFISQHLTKMQLLGLLRNLETGPVPDTWTIGYGPTVLEYNYRDLHQRLLQFGEHHEDKIRRICKKGEEDKESLGHWMTEGLPFLKTKEWQEARLWSRLEEWARRDDLLECIDGGSSEDAPYELHRFLEEQGDKALEAAVGKLVALEKSHQWGTVTRLAVWNIFIEDKTLAHLPQIVGRKRSLPADLEEVRPLFDEEGNFQRSICSYGPLLPIEWRKNYLREGIDVMGFYSSDFYRGIEPEFLDALYFRCKPPAVASERFSDLGSLLEALPLETIRQEVVLIKSGGLQMSNQDLAVLLKKTGLKREFEPSPWLTLKYPQNIQAKQFGSCEAVYRWALMQVFDSTTGSTRADLARILWSYAYPAEYLGP